MSIVRLELQKLLYETREFLHVLNGYLDDRNTTLRKVAVGDSLHVSYGVGMVIQRNVQHADTKLLNDANNLGLSPNRSAVSRITAYSKYKLLSVFNEDLQQSAQWQDKANVAAERVRQTLLQVQEWLSKEGYNIHANAVATPIDIHIKYDEQAEKIKAQLDALLNSAHFKNVSKALTPKSQAKTWVAPEMDIGLNFIRLRLDMFLMKNPEIFKRKLGENAAQVKAKADRMAQDDLANFDFDDFSSKKYLRESKTTANALSRNLALKDFMPDEKMAGKLLRFMDERKGHFGNYTASELEPIVDIEDMKAPEGFGRKKTTPK